MYLVLFLDQDNYEFNSSLHANLAVAKTAYEDLARRFDVKHHEWGFCDDAGEAPHIYRIECDGNPGKEIHPSDLAAV